MRQLEGFLLTAMVLLRVQETDPKRYYRMMSSKGRENKRREERGEGHRIDSYSNSLCGSTVETAYRIGIPVPYSVMVVVFSFPSCVCGPRGFSAAAVVSVTVISS
jgi:hypothetical protein